MTNEEAIKILSVIHLGHSLRVKEACEMGIKALLKEESTADASHKCEVCDKEVDVAEVADFEHHQHNFVSAVTDNPMICKDCWNSGRQGDAT